MIEIKDAIGRVLYEGEHATIRDAVEAAVRAGVRLAGANIHGADLEGADLRGADLTWAVLRGALLTGADLRGADLTGADLSWAKLDRAKLSGAKLDRADLSWAKLEGADLTGADLRGACLRGADITGAKGVRFADAPDPRELRLRVADLIESHPELHDQETWGDGSADASCGTPCCVAGWACRLGGGTRGGNVASAATRLLWLDGAPMPSFGAGATREEIVAALRGESK